jgi:hypothetical protein
VAEQRLDHADVELALQQMGRKAVAQGVKRRAGLDLGGLGGEMKDAVELARRQPARRTYRPTLRRSAKSSCAIGLTMQACRKQRT